MTLFEGGISYSIDRKYVNNPIRGILYLYQIRSIIFIEGKERHFPNIQ